MSDSTIPLPLAPHAARSVAHAGETYALADAWSGDGFALYTMFRYETYAGFQGAAQFEHRRALLALLSRLGDAYYAAALRSDWPEVHANVLTALRQVAGRDSTALAAQYPQTFSPRRPSEPSVEECAKRVLSRPMPVRRRSESPARLLPGAVPVRLPPGAPGGLWMSFTVSATGTPVDYTIGLSSSFDSVTFAAVFDAVRAAVTKWRFAPAEVAGCGVPFEYEAALKP